MALITCNHFSYYLGMDMEMTVLLPEKRQEPPQPMPNQKYPVLYLLHGHSDDHTAYIRKSAIELLVRDHHLIVVMPCAHRGFYTDGKHGHLYYSYIAKELPILVGNFFPASTRPQESFIAGISMGGYGALKIALMNPDSYAGVGVLSGATLLERFKEIDEYNAFTVPDFCENLDAIFGKTTEGAQEESDLRRLIAQCGERGGFAPPIYHSCGMEDMIYSHNIALRDIIQGAGGKWNYTYEEGPGAHDWTFWNRMLPRMLQSLRLI